MYPARIRDQAALLRARGLTWSEVSRALGVNRSTLRAWRLSPPVGRECPHCDGAALPKAGYPALLGYYLGDGHIARAPRYFVLRISCDNAWPGIIADVERLMHLNHPRGRVFRIVAVGCTVVQSNWKHWPCLFPQHGPGKKHERPIVLEPWQRDLVEHAPAAFLRGLFHSDGSRVHNWARRRVSGELKRYDYPRWQFTNHSADIRELCCWALDLVEVPWRRSNPVTISVSRRAAVARLDDLIGPKT